MIDCASTIGMVRSSAEMACCWSSIRVDVADEPRAVDTVGPWCAIRLAADTLRVDRQRGDALRPIGERLAITGEPPVGFGHEPQPGQRFPDDAVATASRENVPRRQRPTGRLAG